MIKRYKERRKRLEEALRAMNELAGWDSPSAEDKPVTKGAKRSKK